MLSSESPSAHRAEPPRAPTPTPAVERARAADQLYQQDREREQRRSLLRGLLWLALLAVIIFSVVRAGLEQRLRSTAGGDLSGRASAAAGVLHSSLSPAPLPPVRQRWHSRGSRSNSTVRSSVATRSPSTASCRSAPPSPPQRNVHACRTTALTSTGPTRPAPPATTPAPRGRRSPASASAARYLSLRAEPASICVLCWRDLHPRPARDEALRERLRESLLAVTTPGWLHRVSCRGSTHARRRSSTPTTRPSS
jgi:hypothetical protein